MQTILLPILSAAALLLAGAGLLFWRTRAKRAKLNREQVDRKLKEDALDRALSNGPRRSPQAQAPVEVRYSAGARREGGAMLRLTELAETTSKEYLFQRGDTLFLGEEYGRAAVFRERGWNKVDCEIFPYQGEVYVRFCGKGGECRLIRGKQRAYLTDKAVCLRSGDKVETQAGVFLVEFI